MATSFPTFNRLKQCRHGMMLYNVNDAYVGLSLDLYGEFSQFEVEFFAQVIREGDVVVDVGANIGSHTLFLAKTVGPRGSVLAFEPQRVVFQTLCANMALNSITNAWCYPLALGAETGVTSIPAVDYSHQGNFGGVSIGAGSDVYLQPRGEPAEVRRLDDLHLPRCRLIKVDVEGWELEALKGMTDTIRRLRPWLYVENDREEKSAELIRFIDQLDYRMYWHFPPLFNPNNFLGNSENVFGPVVSKNMLCIPSEQPADVPGAKAVEVPRM